MKFYFCEGCGKRITEKEIDAGLGKDKKLKGMFCTACAIGVSTMNSLPMSDEQATAVLNADRAKTRTQGSGSHTIGRRKSSKIRTSSGAVRKTEKDESETPLSSNRKSFLMPAVGAGCFLAFGLTIFFAMQSGNKESNAKRVKIKKAKTGKNLAKKVKSGEAKDVVVVKKRPDMEGNESVISAPPKTIEAAAASAESLAEVDLKTLLLFEGLADDDIAGRRVKAQAFLEKHGSSVAALQVQALIEKWNALKGQTAPEHVVSETKPNPQIPPASGQASDSAANNTVAKKEPDLTPGYRAAFDRYLIDAVKALQQFRIKDAHELARSMPQDEALGTYQKDAQALEPVMAILVKRKEALDQKLRGKLNKSVFLLLKKGPPLKGKLIAFENGTLQVEQSIRINGKVMGSQKISKNLLDVRPASLKKLFPIPAPRSSDEWVAVVLEAVAKSDSASAQQGLTQCTTSALHAHLVRLVSVETLKMLERTAPEAWEKLSTSAGRTLNQKQAQAVMDEMAEFESRFADTTFLKDHLEYLKEFKVNVGYVAAGIDLRITKLFKGKINKLDLKDRSISLTYDFLSKDQFEDFPPGVGAGKGNIEAKRGALKLTLHKEIGGFNRMVEMDAFELQPLTVRFTFKVIKHASYGANLYVWMGLPITKSDRSGKPADSRSGLLFYYGRGACGLAGIRIGSGTPYTRQDMAASPSKGTMSVSRKDGVITVMVDNKPLYEAKAPKVKLRPGFGFGGGSDISFEISHLEINGVLDEKWLRKKLNIPDPTKKQ